MRRVLYIIPYYYDEEDESWPIKYCNDLFCGFGIEADGFSTVRLRPDGTPIEGDVTVEAKEDVHAILRAYSDVTVLQDPKEE